MVQDDLERPPGYYRTSLQVALMYVATAGLYGIYWLIRSRYAANKRLGIKDTPWYFWLTLFVPIVFLFTIFSTLSLLEKSCQARLPGKKIVPFYIFGIFYFVLIPLSRLPEPYNLAFFAGCIPVAIMGSVAIRSVESA
jgi:hypothetical protein